jgi:hypothetical protein
MEGFQQMELEKITPLRNRSSNYYLQFNQQVFVPDKMYHSKIYEQIYHIKSFKNLSKKKSDLNTR